MPIFPRLEKEKERELILQFSPQVIEAKAAGIAPPAEEPKAAEEGKSPSSSTAISITVKLDLRVGVVVSAERVKKKEKLLDLRVDVGGPSPRRIIAGIAGSYAPETLLGKRVVVLCNLAPRDFGKGLVSEGMLLAADGKDAPRDAHRRRRRSAGDTDSLTSRVSKAMSRPGPPSHGRHGQRRVSVWWPIRRLRD